MKLRKTFKRVLAYFKGDYEKTLLWFGTRLEGLGEEAPLTMILNGRTDKLCQFINSQLDDNNP